MNSIGSDPMNLQGEQPQSKEPFPLEQVIKDLFTHKIAPYLDAKNLAALSLTSKKMKVKVGSALDRAWKAFRNEIIIGPEKWTEVGFEVAEAPPPPEEIDQILKSDCPYFSGKKVFQTHKLMYIPPGLSINELGSLMRHLREGEHETVFDMEFSWDRIFREIGNEGEPEGYWALVTKDVIPDSRDESFVNQQALLKEGYEVPSVVDVIALATMHCEFSRGERLLPGRQPYWTNTRCRQVIDQRQLLVGAFAPSGLYVFGGNFDFHSVGVCALRKFRQVIGLKIELDQDN